MELSSYGRQRKGETNEACWLVIDVVARGETRPRGSRNKNKQSPNLPSTSSHNQIRTLQGCCKAAPCRRCYSRHILTLEILLLRGTIVDCRGLARVIAFPGPLRNNGRRPVWRDGAEVDPSYHYCIWSCCVGCLLAVCCVSSIPWSILLSPANVTLPDLFGCKRNLSQKPKSLPQTDKRPVRTIESLSSKDMSYEYCSCRYAPPRLVAALLTSLGYQYIRYPHGPVSSR